MNKDKQIDLDRICQEMRQCERYDIRDLRNMLSMYTDPVAGNIIWQASETLRQEGIEFGPIGPRSPFIYTRKTPVQIAERGANFIRAASRKRVRGIERLTLAHNKSEDATLRDRLARRVERENEKDLWQKKGR